MDSSKKLYVALAVLVALGGGVYLQQQDKKSEAAGHSLSAQRADLPKLKIDTEQGKAIDSIALARPAEEAKAGPDGQNTEAKEAQKVVIKRTTAGETPDKDVWELAEPTKYAANASNVKSLLESLGKLEVQEQISAGTDAYAKWGVDESKGLHAVFKKGAETVVEMYFGQSGSRGQMARIVGHDGVYVVKGFQKYLYDRDTSAWRDKSVFKFEENDAVLVSIKNETGAFEFKRQETSWTGTLNGKAIDAFKPSKVDDLLRAYKTLNASEFGDNKALTDVGLGTPKAALTIEFKGGANKLELLVGDTAEGSSRWVKANNNDTLFTISSWSADWATADAGKFAEKPKDEADDAAEAPSGMPGMPGMPGMAPPGDEHGH
ncbi:MAG: hypothetical protein RJA70_4519 [Pseudomonadota bacterium]|jgi:hypothetical protein